MQKFNSAVIGRGSIGVTDVFDQHTIFDYKEQQVITLHFKEDCEIIL